MYFYRNAHAREVIAVTKPDFFNWSRVSASTVLNIAHLAGLWDDEENNILSTGEHYLSRGYAR